MLAVFVKPALTYTSLCERIPCLIFVFIYALLIWMLIPIIILDDESKPAFIKDTLIID